MKTSISFLKSKYERNETIKKIEETDSDYIHVDVMDGRFVEREVLTIDETVNLLKNHKTPLDIHLMCKYPLEYIEAFADLNPEYITIHKELDMPVMDYIKVIKSHGIKPGIGINPETSVEEIKEFLPFVDYIIIMGVNPGAGGQKLITDTVYKIPELIKLREENGYSYQICLDGGVNKDTISLLEGLDVVVSGSYVCMSDNYQEMIDNLRHV